MTIIQFNPNNNINTSKPQTNSQAQPYIPDYPDDSFEFVDYDLDEVEPRRTKEPKNLEIISAKERKNLLKEAWHIYYTPIEELNEKNPKCYYEISYSNDSGNHFEISKYSKKGIFNSYKQKEVFVYKDNAPQDYYKYKLGFSYQGYDGEGWLFNSKEKLVSTCDFLG